MNRILAPLLLCFAAAAWAGDPPALDDAQIAHVAYTAGQIDIDAARLALDKATDPKVRAFAETMLRDHEAVNQQALALVKKLGVTPQDNPTSQALAEAAAAARKTQESLSGTEFERAYAANEASYHAQVNAALRDALIPGADNAELKALLEQGLALFTAHQAHAEALAGTAP